MEVSLVGVPMEILLVITMSLTCILFILIIMLWVKMNRIRKNYMSMLNGLHDANLEQVLMEIQSNMNKLFIRTEESEASINQIREAISHMKGHVGVHRYNAFSESGSDLSFSIAVLDQRQNGVVLSGIHHREETYVYAKPVEQGQSKYVLTPEEKEAINRSLPTK